MGYGYGKNYIKHASRFWKKGAVGIAKKIGKGFVNRVGKNIVRNAKAVLSGKKRWSAKRGIFGRTKKVGKVVTATASPQLSGGMSKNYLGARSAKKQKLPGWYRQILKETRPSVLTGHYQGAMSATENAKEMFVMFKHMDIEMMQQAWKSLVSTNSDSNVGFRTLSPKVYIHDIHREHIFRNATTGNVELEFYHLTPRRDVPRFVPNTSNVLQNFPQVCPAPTTSSGSGGFVNAPSAWTQAITYDQPQLPNTVSTVAFNDLSVTPYMNQTYASAFKIKPLSVTFPSGQKGHKGVLEPGHGVTIECTRMKPFMCNYSKFCIDSEFAWNLDKLYQCIQETPLIMVFVRGGIAHSHAAPTTITASKAKIDYMCNIRFSWVYNQVAQKATGCYTTALATVADEEEVLQPTAADTTVATS